MKKKDKKYYTIMRVESGYCVFDNLGNKCSEENILQITMKKLEMIIRKELDL